MGRLLPLLTNLIPPPLQGKEQWHKLDYYVQLGFLITEYFSMFTQVSLYACFFVVSPPLVWSQSPGRDRLLNASPLLAPPSTHSTLPQDLAVTPDTLLQTEQKIKIEFYWKKMMSQQQLDKYICTQKKNSSLWKWKILIRQAHPALMTENHIHVLTRARIPCTHVLTVTSCKSRLWREIGIRVM